MSWVNSKLNPCVPRCEQGEDNLTRQSHSAFRSWLRGKTAETSAQTPRHRNAQGGLSSVCGKRRECQPTAFPKESNRLKWKFQGRYHCQREPWGRERLAGQGISNCKNRGRWTIEKENQGLSKDIRGLGVWWYKWQRTDLGNTRELVLWRSRYG